MPIDYEKKSSGLIENLTQEQIAELQKATRAVSDAKDKYGENSEQHKAASAKLEKVILKYGLTGWPT